MDPEITEEMAGTIIENDPSIFTVGNAIYYARSQIAKSDC